MKQTMRSICCLLLVACILASVMPVSAAEEKTIVDYVLVLDCSGTMLKNDPKHLAATACKIFIDHIPVQDARVSVITFGYGGGGFDFHNFKVDYDQNLIHRISPLTGDMTLEQKLELHDKITAAAQKKGDNTPVGQALAAAVDTLISDGSTDGNACVILLSDGGLSSPIAYQESINLVDEAAIKAKEHEWPIYCIELDYRNSNESSTKDNRTRLNRICELSGAGRDGRTKVNNPDEVWAAFWKIFGKFNEGLVQNHEDVVIGPDGTVEKSFTVPELSSEAQVIIYGTDVDAVELINKTNNSRVKFTSTKADKKYIVNVDPNYFFVKVVCPEAGDWVAKVYGDANAKVATYIGYYSEMALSIIATTNGDENALTKNDTVQVQSFFTYGGVDVTNNPFYNNNKASLVVTSKRGFVKEYEMTGENNGYHYEFPVSDIPSGEFNVQVVLKHSMFRNGEQVSDSVPFCSVNLPLTLKDVGEIERSGTVNGTFEDVDLTTIFDNPDGDPMEYELLCVSDRSVSFDYEVTDIDMMKISTGMAPGTYQMQIAAKDPDMTEALVYSGLTLTVKNEGIKVLGELEPQRIYTNYADNFIGTIFHKKYADNTVLDIDLNDYYEDPEKVPLTYGKLTADQENLVHATMNGGVLHVEPVDEGNVILKTTVSDSVETIEAVIPVEVVDVWTAYREDYGLYWGLAVLAVVIALAIFCHIKRKSTVRGSWMLTITKGYNSVSIEAAVPKHMSAVTRARNKFKMCKPFAMKDLVVEYLGYIDPNNPVVTEVHKFLNTPEGKAIEFEGVYSGIGFTVMNIPRSDKVAVEYNNQSKPGGKKFRVNGGELRVTLKCETDMGFSESLSICFINTGK